MKKKTPKGLVLNKKTIANLDDNQLLNVKGGTSISSTEMEPGYTEDPGCGPGWTILPQIC